MNADRKDNRLAAAKTLMKVNDVDAARKLLGKEDAKKALDEAASTNGQEMPYALELINVVAAHLAVRRSPVPRPILKGKVKSCTATNSRVAIHSFSGDGKINVLWRTLGLRVSTDFQTVHMMSTSDFRVLCCDLRS